MKKRNVPWRRLLAVLTSLLMMLVLLAPSAFAEDPDSQQPGTSTASPITLTKPNSMNVSWSGMTVNAYKVFTKVATTSPSGSEALYAVESQFEAFFNIDGIKGSFGTTATETKTLYLYYDSTNNKLNVTDVLTNVPEGATFITLPTASTGALDPTYSEADLLSRIQSNGQITDKNGEIATFYTWLEKYIETAADALTPDATATAGSENTVTIDDVTSDGYYALLFSGTHDGLSVIQGILVENGTTLNMKAEEIPLTKQVKNTATSHNNESFRKDTTAEVGDPLQYQITTRVPSPTDPDNLTSFLLTDTLTNQKLTGDLTLKVGSDTFTAAIPPENVGQEYSTYFTRTLSNQTTQTLATLSVKAYANGSQSFTVNFLYDETNITWQNYLGQTVTLTCSATLTSAAIATNPNDVTLTFTNNNDVHTLSDRAVVHTYGIEVQKTFSDQRVTDTAVTFQLYRADKDGTLTGAPLTLVQVNPDPTTGKGVYRLPDASEAANTTNVADLKLDASGKLTITGLDVGTYWLVETQAPDGFAEADPIQIVLKADSVNKAELDAGASTAKYENTNDDLLTTTTKNSVGISLGQFTVLNQKGFDLPQTGSAGTWMFTVGGILLIAAAGALFLSSRKKNNSK